MRGLGTAGQDYVIKQGLRLQGERVERQAADAQEGREDFLIVRTSPLPPGSLRVESSEFRVQMRAAAQTKPISSRARAVTIRVEGFCFSWSL